MNQATKSTYQNDLIFQGLFYFPMLLLYLIGFAEPGGFIIGALTQFFVGVVQVLSGAFHSIRYEDQAHKRYFMITIGYVCFLILGSVFLSNTTFNFGILRIFISNADSSQTYKYVHVFMFNLDLYIFVYIYAFHCLCIFK